MGYAATYTYSLALLNSYTFSQWQWHSLQDLFETEPDDLAYNSAKVKAWCVIPNVNGYAERV